MISIKTPSNATIPHVWSRDPALDKASPVYDWDKFVETGDLVHVPAKDGRQLTFFDLGRLTRRQHKRMTQLQARGDEIEAAHLIVAYGVKNVRNWVQDGSPLQVTREETADGDRLSDKTLDAIYDVGLFVELATRLVKVSELSPLDG